MSNFHTPSSLERLAIFVEPWSSDYGSPLQIDEDASANGGADLIDEEGFAFVECREIEPVPLAFIDGVRRQEAALSQYRAGRSVAGITGAYAVGAVLCDEGSHARFSDERVHRAIIWSAGAMGAIPDLPGGWSWVEERTPDTNPGAALRRLQDLMRHAESDLAAALAERGYLVLLDGTLWYASGHAKKNVAGYVKTHHVRLLPEEEARKLPELPARQRTTLFRTESNRYGFYLRLAEPAQFAPPMASIVRLEFSGTLSLDEARLMADRFGHLLPKFAGVPHVDPRAPQNLQPIGALETHLRHLMGDAALAERAARDSVASLFTMERPHART